MGWSLSAAAVLGGVAAVISLLVALYALRHRNKRMALPFVALEGTLAAWSLAYGIQLGYGTLSEQLFWQRLSLSIAGFVTILWLLFAAAYTGRERWLTRRRISLILIEPLAFTAFCLTNPSHGLAWSDAALTSTVLGEVPALTFGIGYYVHIAYAYPLIALGIGLIVLHGTRTAPSYQRQVLLLVLASAPPFLTHVAFSLGASPVPHLDLTPFLFAFTGVALGLALFQFDLLYLAPVARNQAFDELGDGLLIVNNDGEIVDLIGVVSAVLTPTPRVGDSVSAVFSDTRLRDLDGAEVTATLDGEKRMFQFQTAALSAYHDQRMGTLLILRDITGLRESRQRLSVSNRVLRHNLRNDMNIVMGYASELESRLDGSDARDARKIRKTVEDFVELAEKAERIGRVHAAEENRTTVAVGRRLRGIVDELRAEFPAVEFDVRVADDVSIGDVDPELFDLAFQNVLDNAARHNDAEDPQVDVGVVVADEAARIAVSDNGPGIPDVEREAVGGGVETQLEHSQGLGLWLTYWCVRRWGGELLIDSAREGSTVTLTVPADDRRIVPDAAVADAPASRRPRR